MDLFFLVKRDPISAHSGGTVLPNQTISMHMVKQPPTRRKHSCPCHWWPWCGFWRKEGSASALAQKQGDCTSRWHYSVNDSTRVLQSGNVPSAEGWMRYHRQDPCPDLIQSAPEKTSIASN